MSAADELARARALLLERRIGPLVDQAVELDGARRPDDVRLVRMIGRRHVLAFLAKRLALEEVDPAALDLEGCRAAWHALTGGSYAEIKHWCQYGDKALKKEKTI